MNSSVVSLLGLAHLPLLPHLFPQCFSTGFLYLLNLCHTPSHHRDIVYSVYCFWKATPLSSG